MKKIHAIVCAIAAALFGVVAVGCNNRPHGTVGTLSIAIFEGGYGNTWGEALKDAYVRYHPDVKVKVDCDPLVRDDAVTAMQTNMSSVDLYFIDGMSVGMYCETYGSMGDLTELYSMTPKAGDTEEAITIKDKLLPEVVSEMQYGGDQSQFFGKYYTVPSASGPCSLILNVDALDMVFGEGQWSEPRTTDELLALCEAIKTANKKVTVGGISQTIYPFIYSGKAVEYWHYLYYPWIAQYAGIDAWDDMQTVRIGGEYDQAAYQPDGKLQAYSVLETLIKRSNDYCDPSSMNNDFNATQRYFLQGRACMYISGDWFEREVSNSKEYKPEVRMIKTPVISDLAEKIETELSVSLGATDADKDKKLAEIVSAVDKGESVDGVDQAVIDRVAEARSYVYTLANSAIGVMPAVSVNKDLVIDFLRFMYSDEGIQIVLDETGGSYLPVADTQKFTYHGERSEFRTSVTNIVNSAHYKTLMNSSKDPIHYRAGLDTYIGTEKPEVALGKKTGALTAAAYLAKERTMLGERWNEFMRTVSGRA